jgi:hypothetical protein
MMILRRLHYRWYLSSLRRWLLDDPAKIDAYNAAVDEYNREVDGLL